MSGGRTVWLASYPKSGNTWVRALYGAWTTGRPPDLNELPGGPIASARQAIDGALGISTADLSPDEIDQLRPRADEVADEREPDVNGIHLRKVHDAFFLGPAGEPVVSVAASRAAIYVVRDPRDVAVSLAHHLGQPPERAADFLADPAAMVAGRADRLAPQVRQRLGTWSQHVSSWTEQARVPVHVLRYEDCQADAADAWAGVLRFLGMPTEPDRVRASVELCSFARLRDQEAAAGFRERGAAQPSFFRAGRSGGGSTVLGGEVAARIGADHAALMARLGYANGAAPP